MDSNIVDLIICPACTGDLKKKNNKTIVCIQCSSSYSIIKGIPILIDLAHLPEHLQGQIEYFEKEDVTSSNEYRLDPWQESYVNRFKNTLPKLKNKLVIDCGTGSGYMAIELAKKGSKVVACDLTLKSLIRLQIIAKKLKLDKYISFVCCTAEQLPFKSSVADYFISNAVLEHLPREKEAIAEINRVCKQSASLMVAVPLSYKYLHPLLIPLNYYHDRRIGHLRRYDEVILKKKFKNWKIIQTYYTGHFNKVLKTVVNIFFNFFDKNNIESEDNRYITEKRGASNIICFLKRNK